MFVQFFLKRKRKKKEKKKKATKVCCFALRSLLSSSSPLPVQFFAALISSQNGRQTYRDARRGAQPRQHGQQRSQRPLVSFLVCFDVLLSSFFFFSVRMNEFSEFPHGSGLIILFSFLYSSPTHAAASSACAGKRPRARSSGRR
jgi:hypothetical protein